VTKQIVIIGAGVIGAASALALQKDGHKVLLIDREAPCSGASFGNAGAIVNGSCAPTAMPGIIFEVLKMIGQPLSPPSISPKYFLNILPWLIRFVMQSRQSAVYKNATHLSALSKHAIKGWQNLLEQTNLSLMLKETGWLKVYETEKSFAGTLKSRQLLDKMGTKYELLSANEIRDLEPNLATVFNHGIYQKDSMHISNPEKLVHGMVDLFIRQGGTYQQFSVNSIETNNEGVTLVGSSGTLKAEQIVIAAGAWSRALARQLGDNIPLDTERGYHLMMPESTGSLLNGPVMNGEHSFILSPMETGLRLTSQVELSGLEIQPDYRHIRNLLPAVRHMLPTVDTSEKSVWMGFRPSLPDSLPVIGSSTKSNKVLYAFGHQHLGMTLGAISALIVADLAVGRKPITSVTPYSPRRF
jgi:D-amino-acid dehydrogenase